MARSDSFFIRAKLNAGGSSATGFNTFFQEGIDLGAYVDALGKSVLRIHNIAVSVTDTNNLSVEITGAEEAAAQFVLTTQSQGTMPAPSDRAVISSGSILASRTATGNGLAARNYEEFDNLPQLWTNGYLVAVDQIFLGGQASEFWQGDVVFHITMECTVETMTQAAAMALALSQQ
ncbi:MAG: hypothetical protein [Circular genetic element sp.]|nr:MAG: hypothetical protein [Circular genetic element sp.]|tara:strand:- start:971 stop:1498 length:528 start_codon:yes stop_codon:yes gene_type:complete